jgi:hypothetical protein
MSEVIWVRDKADYFCEGLWTGQITLIRLKKSAFCRKSREASNRVKAKQFAEFMKEDRTPPCIRENQGALSRAAIVEGNEEFWVEPNGFIVVRHGVVWFVLQCENRIGSGGFDSRLLVAPPTTNSRRRECPYAPMTSMSAAWEAT